MLLRSAVKSAGKVLSAPHVPAVAAAVGGGLAIIYLGRRKFTSGAGRQPWIHMNAAGASPQPDEVHDAMVAHLELERSVGAYAAASQLAERPELDAHTALAKLLNCDGDEIALAESAQRAWALCFSSVALTDHDRILCFTDEYAGNAVAFLQAVKRTGCTLEVLPMRSDGICDMEALKTALENPPRHLVGRGRGPRTVVCLTHVASAGSIVQPAAEVGVLAKQHGALYILDACQSIGQMPVDVRGLRCDFACGTGRKWLRGPRGTGFLYCRRGALSGEEPLVGEPATIDHTSVKWTSRDTYELAAGAARYEMWESSHASRAGLAAAAAFCSSVGPDVVSERSTALARRLRQGLSQLRGLVLMDAPSSFDEGVAESLGASRCAHVTFEAETTLRLTAEKIHKGLLEMGIGGSISPPTHSFDEALWRRPRVVRLSPTYFNTEEEVDRVVAAVREILCREW